MVAARIASALRWGPAEWHGVRQAACGFVTFAAYALSLSCRYAIGWPQVHRASVTKQVVVSALLIAGAVLIWQYRAELSAAINQVDAEPAQ